MAFVLHGAVGVRCDQFSSSSSSFSRPSIVEEIRTAVRRPTTRKSECVEGDAGDAANTECVAVESLFLLLSGCCDYGGR